MEVTFESFDAYKYVQVFKVTEWRGNQVFKTEHKGYALATRTKQGDEVYSSLSTHLLRHSKITLELLE